MAPSPRGKARVCKTLITSSNLVGASKKITKANQFALKKSVRLALYNKNL